MGPRSAFGASTRRFALAKRMKDRFPFGICPFGGGQTTEIGLLFPPCRGNLERPLPAWAARRNLMDGACETSDGSERSMARKPAAFLLHGELPGRSADFRSGVLLLSE